MRRPAGDADGAGGPSRTGTGLRVLHTVFIDFSKQTFIGMPTPKDPITVLVSFTTECDVNGCVARWKNETENVRNPGAPSHFDYRWTGGRWNTSGEYPYLCNRDDPASAVTSHRSDYLTPAVPPPAPR